MPLIYLIPFTLVEIVTELELLDEQVRLKVLMPPTEIIKDSEPDVDFEPDHPPDAEQLDADVEDQLKEIVESTWADSEEAERLTTILFTEGAGMEDAISPLPPPPPPPQAERMIAK